MALALLVVLLSAILPQHTTSAAEIGATLRHIAPAHVASNSLLHAGFSIPTSNVAASGPVLDERHVVYGVASPRMHAPTCVSCGDRPFTGFHLQIFIRSFRSGGNAIVVSQPRVLFTGPRGAQVAFLSFHHNWLIYETYLPGDRWTLLARNVVSGRQILLDSPQREGAASPLAHAGSDGSTVVWQSWTRVVGKTVSVIRSYSVIIGQRRLLISGGTGEDSFYTSPEVSGDRLVFTREYPDGTAQLFLASMTTGRVRALTPLHQINREAAIARNVLVWVHGDISLGHTHGLVVENLATGHRVALPHSSTQLPRIAAGRYVAFATVYRTTSVEVYDTRTHQRRTITARAPAVGPGSSGGQVEAGGHTVLYSLLASCGSTGALCPSRFMLVDLP
jgi:hypothetical protein